MSEIQFTTRWSDCHQKWTTPQPTTDLNTNLGLPFGYFKADSQEKAISFTKSLPPLKHIFEKGYFPEDFFLGLIPSEPIPTKWEWLVDELEKMVFDNEIIKKAIFKAKKFSKFLLETYSQKHTNEWINFYNQVLSQNKIEINLAFIYGISVAGSFCVACENELDCDTCKFGNKFGNASDKYGEYQQFNELLKNSSTSFKSEIKCPNCKRCCLSYELSSCSKCHKIICNSCNNFFKDVFVCDKCGIELAKEYGKTREEE
jgi:hypothetical protein